MGLVDSMFLEFKVALLQALYTEYLHQTVPSSLPNIALAAARGGLSTRV